MAYFARKIDYVGSEHGFVALLAIVRKKGGSVCKFILYRYISNDYNERRHEIVELGANESDKAKKWFPYGPGGFLNPLDDRWQKITNERFYDVAVGGEYQIHCVGDWVRVGRPRRWKDRRKNKKKVLKFGELAHIYMVYEKILENLQRELCETEGCGWDRILEEDVFEKKDEIESRISQVQGKLNGLKEEMRYVRRNRNLG